MDDTARATEDGSAVTINVLVNDSDPEGKALTLASATQPANGASIVEGSVVKYTPNPGYYGSDTFHLHRVRRDPLVCRQRVSDCRCPTATRRSRSRPSPCSFVPISGGGERILLSDYFSDPDDGHPPYQATTSDSAIADSGGLRGLPDHLRLRASVSRPTTLTVSDTPGISQEFRVVVYRQVVARTKH